MKIQTLEYFVTLAQSRSINEAASKLYIPQPSLSKSLQLFEKEIGVQLFVRTEQGIVLTDAGKKILPEAKQVLAYYNGWKTLSKREMLQRLDIFSHTSFPDFLLPDIILALQKKYPGVSVNYSISIHPEKYISSQVEEPSIALFSCSGKDSLQRYTRKQGNPPLILLQGQYCCLVNRRSPLAKKKTVSAEELKDLYLVSPNSEMTDINFYSTLNLANVIDKQHIINVNTTANVIKLICQDPETYALSYYPALKRYEMAAQGELVPVFFQGRTFNEPLCLFYSRQAYQEFSIVRELVDGVGRAAKEFLRSYGGGLRLD